MKVKPYKLGQITVSQPRQTGDLPPERPFPVKPLGARAVQEALREIKEWPYPFPRPLGKDERLGLVTWQDKDGRDQMGTLPEYAVFWALEQVQAVFGFQSPMLGGRHEQLGVVGDFSVYEPIPNLIIRVMGEFWHYERGEDTIQSDYLQKIRLMNVGLMVIDIDGEDALRDPIYYVERAFEGIDLSRAARELY